MRILGLVLALGAIIWVMLQAGGGSDAETVISAGQQEALQKAGGLEDSLNDAAQRRLEAAEELQ